MYNKIMCNFDNLLDAYRLAHRSKTDDLRVIDFDKNKIFNLYSILDKLERKDFDHLFEYYRFNLYRPKERIVDALAFEGRIVQHVLCDNILKPYFEPRLIKENCACRVGKGTRYAISLVKHGMIDFLKTHNDGYVLKMDVKKYFPSIDRKTLKELLNKFPDKEIKKMLFWIIDHCPDSNGLPIGNQTSQWFALYYLDGVDRIIKEKYRIKYYARYMDDLIIIHKDKTYLHKLLSELRIYAKDRLKLEFNSKTQIFPLHKGISFLGWKYFYNRKTKQVYLRIDSSKKAERNHTIRSLLESFARGEISLVSYNSRMLSILNNLNIGATFHYQLSHYTTLFGLCC